MESEIQLHLKTARVEIQVHYLLNWDSTPKSLGNECMEKTELLVKNLIPSQTTLKTTKLLEYLVVLSFKKRAIFCQTDQRNVKMSSYVSDF